MSFLHPGSLSERLAAMPSGLPILPLRNSVAYPLAIMPLVVGIRSSLKLIEDALEGNHLIGLLSVIDSSTFPNALRFFPKGLLGTHLL